MVVTNQAGVAHGYFPESRVGTVHRALSDLLAAEDANVASYYCLHHPEAKLSQYRVTCDCRKLQPGLLLRAAHDLDLDLSRSYMIGDKASDLTAGRATNCGVILVETGYGVDVWQTWHECYQPGFVAADLLAVVNWILDRNAALLRPVVGGAGLDAQVRQSAGDRPTREQP
jgi:D-glycero-D-manno-heptose 1,7-bisphosphate phosphatase